jgi:hypothetical protein
VRPRPALALELHAGADRDDLDLDLDLRSIDELLTQADDARVGSAQRRLIGRLEIQLRLAVEQHLALEAELLD